MINHGAAPQRAELQGLRGIAVLLVVLYHAGVPFLPGGYVGVDVFFVISGFLITGLLVREVDERGRIDYLRFVARRARRLLPAALVVIAAVVATSVIVYPPLEREGIFSAARAAAIYAANIWFAGRAVDYLGGDAAANPMTHMWSLGVEEQFYLVWPWLISISALGLAQAEARGRTLCIVLVVCVVSFIACVWMTASAQPWAFFGTPFRAWEFGLGAAVMLFTQSLKRLPLRAVRVAGAVGAVAVVASAALLNDATPFPGAWALLPAGGTALVLASLTLDEPNRLKALLSKRLLTRAGDISYSWYLWHWPLLVMAPVLFPDGRLQVTVAAVALSLLLAELSYRFVEEPIRHQVALRLPSGGVVTVALALTVAAAATLTLMKRNAAGQQASSLSQQLYQTARNDRGAVYAQRCHVGITETQPGECTAGASESRHVVVLFGDSHAAHWFPALEQLAIERNWKLVSISKSACPSVDAAVLLESHRRPYRECTEWRAAALRRIAELKPALVFIANSGRYASVSGADWQTATRRTLDIMAGIGAATVVVRDTPWPGFGVPACLARADHMQRSLNATCAFDREASLAPGAAKFEAEQSAAAAASRAMVIDMTPHICSAARCQVITGGVVHFSDDNHLTATYSRSLAKALAAALKGAHWDHFP